MSKIDIDGGMKRIKELIDAGKIKYKKLRGDIRFECQRDSRCCSLFPVILLDEEIDILAEFNGAFKNVENIPLLKDSYKRCRCLEQNRCLIYDERPISCIAYPFHLDPLTNELYYDEKCLGIGKGKIIDEERLNKIKEYRLKFWNFFSLSKKEKETVHEIMFKQ